VAGFAVHMTDPGQPPGDRRDRPRWFRRVEIGLAVGEVDQVQRHVARVRRQRLVTTSGAPGGEVRPVRVIAAKGVRGGRRRQVHPEPVQALHLRLSITVPT